MRRERSKEGRSSGSKEAEVVGAGRIKSVMYWIRQGPGVRVRLRRWCVLVCSRMYDSINIVSSRALCALGVFAG